MSTSDCVPAQYTLGGYDRAAGSRCPLCGPAQLLHHMRRRSNSNLLTIKALAHVHVVMCNVGGLLWLCEVFYLTAPATCLSTTNNACWLDANSKQSITVITIKWCPRWAPSCALPASWDLNAPAACVQDWPDTPCLTDMNSSSQGLLRGESRLSHTGVSGRCSSV